MLIQGDMALKRLTTRLTFNLLPSIRMRTLVTAQIGELSVGFGTVLDENAKVFRGHGSLRRFDRMPSFAYITFPWFDAGMNVSVLLQSGGRLKAFAAVATRVKSIFTFTGLARVRCIAIETCCRSIDNHANTIEHSKNGHTYRMLCLFVFLFSSSSSSSSPLHFLFLLRSEVVERRTFLKLKFDWLNMNRRG